MRGLSGISKAKDTPCTSISSSHWELPFQILESLKAIAGQSAYYKNTWLGGRSMWRKELIKKSKKENVSQMLKKDAKI